MCVLAVVATLTCLAAESESLVEVKHGTTVMTGKLLAKDAERTVLLDRTGRLFDLELNSITLKPTSSRFEPLAKLEFRNQLAREFGKEMDVGSTRHYLVVAPAGRASEYADVFEDQYSTLHRYFKTRGFTLTDPQFPLVAIVLPNQRKFLDYMRDEGSKSMADMKGYYSPRTNRVAPDPSRERAPPVRRPIRYGSREPGSAHPPRRAERSRWASRARHCG